MKQANPLLENAMCNALAGRFLCCRPTRSKFRSDRVLQERFAACVADRHIEAFDVDAHRVFKLRRPASKSVAFHAVVQPSSVASISSSGGVQL